MRFIGILNVTKRNLSADKHNLNVGNCNSLHLAFNIPSFGLEYGEFKEWLAMYFLAK